MNRFYYLSLQLILLGTPFLSWAQEDPFRDAVNAYINQKQSSKEKTSAMILALDKKVTSAPVEANNEIDALLPYAKKLKDRKMEVNLMRVKAASHFYQGKFQMTEQIGKEALSLAERYGLQADMPKIFATIGSAEIYQSKLIEALETQNKGLKIAEKLDDKGEIGRAHV